MANIVMTCEAPSDGKDHLIVSMLENSCLPQAVIIATLQVRTAMTQATHLELTGTANRRLRMAAR